MKGSFKGSGLFLLTSALSLTSAGTALAAVQSTSDFQPNQVIVKYKDSVRRSRFSMENLYIVADVIKVKRFHGGSQKPGQSGQMEQLILKDGADVQAAITTLEKNPAVEYAQPNYILHALPVANVQAKSAAPFQVPNMLGLGFSTKDGDTRPPVGEKPGEVNPPVADPDIEKAWGVNKVGAPQVWAQHNGSAKMVVAVIDTGVDYTHEDLAFNIWRNPNPDQNDLVGYDFIHNDGLPFDDHSHGTHCSGVIGAVGGNGIGISGVNQRVSIMALKFLSAQGSGDTAGAIKAIDYAVAHGAKVLSNSWGGKGDDGNQALGDAIKRAADKEVLFVAAAGNDGSDDDTDMTYPASFNLPNMLTVAALDSNDGVASFSNYGAKSVHVGAPGVDVYSTIPGGYGNMSGTSMACPHVAGAAALVWSAHPEWTVADVRSHLMDNVDKVSGLEGRTVSGGRINVAKALGIE